MIFRLLPYKTVNNSFQLIWILDIDFMLSARTKVSLIIISRY